MPKLPNSSLNYSSKPMKRSAMKPRKNYMPRVSKQRAAKRRIDKERFADSQGVYFDEARAIYMATRDKIKVRQVDNADVLGEMHSRFTQCMLSGLRSGYLGNPLEAHHIIPRSDELTNIVIISRKEHMRVQDSPDGLRECLLAKWKHDRETLSWVRLALLRGKWFPFDDLITEVPHGND